MTKKEWFTQIPNSLIKTGKLTARELGLYTYYKSFAGEDGYCNVTQEKASEDLSLSTTTYRVIRDSLIKKGYIRLKRLSQKRLNIYIVDIWEQNNESFKTYIESNVTHIESECDIEEEPINNQKEYIINNNDFSEKTLDPSISVVDVKEPPIESHLTQSSVKENFNFDEEVRARKKAKGWIK